MTKPRTVDAGERPGRPVVVYDGGCGFCRRSVAWLESRAGQSLETVPAALLGERLTQVDRGALGEAMVLVTTDGKVRRGMAAVCRALWEVPGHGLPWLVYRFVPGAAWLGEKVYRAVANHRGRMEGAMQALSGPPTPATFGLARRAFFFLLGLAMVLWFGSFAAEVPLLIGPDGLLPAGDTMAEARTVGLSPWDLPVLFWLGAESVLPWVLCGLGGVAGLVLIAGLVPRLCLLAGWLCMLSLVHAGGVLAQHPGDRLLLETTVLALLLAPPGLRPDWGRSPLPAARWLLLFLLLRSVGVSAWEAIAGGPAGWLEQWLYSQPLPSALGLWALVLPGWVLGSLSVLALAVAALAPVLVFTFRWPRLFAAVALLLVVGGYAAAGSQGVMPFVLLALIVLAIDDEIARGALPRWVERQVATVAAGVRRGWSAVHGVCSALLFAAAVVAVSGVPAGVASVLVRFGVAFDHGGLAQAVTPRPVLVVQGSLNRASWHPYETKVVPGAADRVPAYAVRLRRLDDGLAMAARDVAAGAQVVWIERLALRLLQGRAPVRRAFAAAPFPGKAPLQVRFVLFRYRVAGVEERRQGLWWVREEVGVVGRPFELGG